METVKSERSYFSVDPVLFTADGQENGIVTVQDTKSFKVKMTVTIKSDVISQLNFEVKRVLSETQMIIGPDKENIKKRSDMSAYLVSDNAQIWATEQDRPSVTPADQEQATYEEEPTMARRVFLVDKYGNGYTLTNPLPTDAVINLDGAEIDLKLPTQRSLNIIEAVNTNEIQFDIPDNTKKYRILVRENTSGFRISYQPGGTDSNDYIKIRRGNYWEEPEMDLPNNSKIYIKADKANTTFQIVTYQLI